MRAETQTIPWQARARIVAQGVGLDPRYVRRIRWFHKAVMVRRSAGKISAHLPFVLLSPQPDNFTFALANLSELAAWTSAVARCSVLAAEGYVAEPGHDAHLRAWLRRATSGRWLWSEVEPAFGKRVGWYALVRALRPRTVVEIGAHDGLGSLLLLRALERNAAEGHAGRLTSYDINPAAGWLVAGHPFWDLRIESSHDGLPGLLEACGGLDMLVYDGWHAYAPERADLEHAVRRLTPDGVLVSDDAQTTHALADVCRENGLSYFEFHEVPLRHFHPGATLGAGRRLPP